MVLESALLYAWLLTTALGHNAPGVGAAETKPGIHAIRGFGAARIIEETFPRSINRDPDWWVSSGARFTVEQNGIAHTLIGEMPSSDPWRARYARSSAALTQGGRYPQHIFRMIHNVQGTLPALQRVYFQTHEERASSADRVRGSVCLMLQYQNEEDTYYGCLAQDGRATIKRKRGGEYLTLADVYGTALPAPGPNSPWTGISFRSEKWKEGTRLVLARDEGDGWDKLAIVYDSEPLPDQGSAGIRTDLLDVRFRAYELVLRVEEKG